MKLVIAIALTTGLLMGGSVFAQQSQSEGERLDAAYNAIMRNIADHYVENAGATSNPLNQPAPGPILNSYELRNAVQNALNSMRDRRFRVLSADDLAALEAHSLAGVVGLGADLVSVDLVGDQGVKVTGINSGSFAMAAGINKDDRILSIDDRPVSGMRSSEVDSLLRAPGAPPVKLVVVKWSGLMRVSVPRHADGTIGISYMSVQPTSLPKVGDVDPRGPAAEAGLRTGDIITAIDGITTRTIPLSSLTGYINSGAYLSTFDLNIMRFGVPMQVHVQRRVIEGTLSLVTYRKKVGATTAELADPRLSNGLISIRDFDWTSRRVLSGLDNFLSEVRQLPGVILDLQSSGGSNADTAAQIVARFSEPGEILKLVEGFGANRVEILYSLSSDGVLTKAFSGARSGRQTLATNIKPYNGKVVVAINGNTWGGAAAVAQSLQARGRAQVVGRAASGDGSILGLIFSEVSGATIWVQGPTAKFLKTDGGAFTGVVPDMESSSSADSAFEALDPFPSFWTWGLVTKILGTLGCVVAFLGALIFVVRRRSKAR